MTKPYTFSFPSHIDPDARRWSSVQERVLNEAIVRADIAAGFEEYLEIFDKFYAEDVEARGAAKNQFAERRGCAPFFSGQIILALK